jgi:hypothetical protein
MQRNAPFDTYVSELAVLCLSRVQVRVEVVFMVIESSGNKEIAVRMDHYGDSR